MGQAQTSMPMFTCSHGAETLQRPSCSSFHPRRACPQEGKKKSHRSEDLHAVPGAPLVKRSLEPLLLPR